MSESSMKRERECVKLFTIIHSIKTYEMMRNVR